MDNAPPPIVHVVDDDASLRRALVFLLESSGWRVAPHDSAEAFLAAWPQTATTPGCLVLDIRMPVIFLTGHADVSMAVEAMKLGASDFIEKPFKDQALLDAVGKAIRHDIARREECAARQALCERLERLSPREREVAQWVAEGLPNKVIGQRLDISERTVQVHRLHLMEKLGIHSAAELAQLMLRAE